MTEKVKLRLQGRETCEKHNKALKIAFDAVTGTLVCNQCLFEQQLEQSHSSVEVKQEPAEYNQSHVFTALITRELKTKFDELYRGYKEGLCDVAEIDHANVRDMLVGQARQFFASVRSRVQTVRHDVNQRVSAS